MTELLIGVARSDTCYPKHYGSSTVFHGGSTDIHYYGGGYKSPNSSLYESKAGEGLSDDDEDAALDATTPTIVFEVAYKTSRNLAIEAARHICLTMGRVLLVVAINIIHEPNTHPRKIKSVTWSHWEEDIGARGVVIKQDGEEVNEIRAERTHSEDDVISQILPTATAFSALISVPGDDNRYRIRVAEMAKWEV